ncbi:MAG: helix-turn-helix transcriptional regulator [bacterium]|nr:helix-turn-helix transcriptional regulator [bacterium]
MLIGKRLKKLRVENNMSQQQLGDLIGVTKVSICGYENGTRTPCLDTFWMISDIFSTSGDYLAGREMRVVSENEDDVNYMSADEVDIIKALRKHPELHQSLIENPERMLQLISKKIPKS